MPFSEWILFGVPDVSEAHLEQLEQLGPEANNQGMIQKM
jgi:hypothetical protein